MPLQASTIPSRTNRWPRRIAVLTLIVVVLSACTASGQGTDADSAGGAPAGGQTTLTVALGTLGTMDFAPATSNEDNEKWLSLMGDNLVTLNPETAQYEGELAESWEVSDDGRVWTFRLRPDVQFHDGWGTVTADDVKFSWGEWISEESTHNPQLAYAQAVGGSIDGFEVVSDLEFRLHAEEPVNHLLGLVCSCEPGMTVFPREYYEQNGEEANAHPVGTGPWQFVSKTDGEELVLERFDDYWGEAPKFERLVIKEIPDGAARLTQVQAGTVDMAELDGTLIGEVEANPDLSVMSIPNVRNAFIFLGGSYWGTDALDRDAPWIQADEPEKGLAIRQAMSLAIDREAVLEQALGGYGMLSYGPLMQNPLNPDLIDPSWELPEYNLELAKQKLAEGGYPDGFEVTMPLYGDDFDTVAMGEMIAGMWEELGLTVNRMPTEDAVISERENAYETEGLVWVTTVSLAPEAARPLIPYVQKEEGEGARKFTHPVINEAYEALSSEPDEGERRRITRDMIGALREEEIALTLMAGDMLFVAGPRIDPESWEPIPGLNTINRLETLELVGG